MTKKDREKAAQRRAAREERREAQRRAEALRRRRRTLTWSAAGALVIVAIAALLARSGALGSELAALLGRPRPVTPAPAVSPAAAVPPGAATPAPAAREERPPDAGALHIAPGQKGRGYTSNPPTSGEHYPSTVPWGVHSQVFPDELVIHNLEHAGVWISYRDPNDSDLAGKLARIVDRYRTKVVLTARPANDAPIAVAAWGHLLKLQAFDEARIVAFIEAYRGKVGPEPNAP